MKERGRFPFGAPVQPCGDGQPDRSDVLVLGAYPSAIHIRWVPPRASGLKPISALAVDNEPTVFWDGSDAEERVTAWKDRYFDPAWGEAKTARLNGPSGTWLRSNILEPLAAAGASSHFVTDCLTTYRLSTGAAARLRDTYEPMVNETPGLRSASLLPHPSEGHIVREALESEGQRLLGQIAAAQPRAVLTLGNAASRVISSLSNVGGPGKLEPDVYGRPSTVTLSNIGMSWIALVHPAAPAAWQVRHEEWLANQGFSF